MPDVDEQNRLAVLKSFHILDTPHEEVFDRLTQLAAAICRTPVAVITLVDERRQWFKSAVGLQVRETERAISFCTHTIRAKRLFIVPDARTDPLFSANPFVVGKPNLLFYGGVPLISPGGFALGTLAVMDHVPRTLDEIQIASLQMLAEQVMMHLELRRQHKELQNLAMERDRIHAELLHKAERLQQAQRIGKMGNWELHVEKNRLFWSDEVNRIFGMPSGTQSGSLDAFMSVVHPADRKRIVAALDLTLQGKAAFDVEYQIVRNDGEVRYVHGLGELQISKDGARVVAGTTQDVTERRQSQKQLYLLENCVSRMTDMVMITEAEPLDAPGPRIVFVNDAFKRHTGYDRDEVLGKSPRILQGPATRRDELDRVRASLEKGEAVSVELINYTKTGKEFWVEIDMAPVEEVTGRLTHFVAIQRVITERKQQTVRMGHINQALQMLTRGNEALIKIEHEQDLLDRICNLAVEVGGYRTAWAAHINSESGMMTPIAHAGAGQLAPFAEVRLPWSRHKVVCLSPGAHHPHRVAPIMQDEFFKEPSFSSWRTSSDPCDYCGMICLPLRDKDRAFGVLALHTSELRPVAEEEMRLLQELSDNLAFGIGNIRSQEERRRIEAAVLKVAAGVSASTGEEFFEQLTRNMAEALNAQAGFIARLLPGGPLTARTISAVVDGQATENFDYSLKGTPCENLLENSCWVVPNHVADCFPQSPSLAAIGAQGYVGRRLDNSDGQPIGLLFVLFREPLEQSDVILSTIHIFAARAAAELERQEADNRIRNQASLLDKAQDAIIVCGTDHRIVFWNKGAERLYGWAAEESLGKGKDALIFEDPAEYEQATEIVMQLGEWRGEVTQRRKDGTHLTVEAHWSLVKDDQDQPQSVLAIHTDISERKKAEQAIEQLAFYDPLTRLPNRRLLLDRLQHALAMCERNHLTGALLFIDLDNFKSLNDTLGHDRGDMLLQQVARRLETCVRKSNTVARLGGDEFVIMLEDLSPNGREAAAQAEVVGEKILAVFNQPFQLGGSEHHSTPSIGVTLFSSVLNNVDDLLKRADLAMYQAKAAGRNAVRFFDPEMQRVVNARVALETDFRRSLKKQEFMLHYQTQTDDHGRITGVEALLRWHHARRGMVDPAAFIALAEETGLIMHLGHWVLKTACTQLAAWACVPEKAHLGMAVNVSARQFRHPDFVDQVVSVLETTGANPERLKLELTESLLVENIEDTITKMTALKAKGVGFSLDDFGTGYSSLSYLKVLPLDQLKIDQSFVRDVLTDSNDAAIARTIVALGQTLGLEVIAEGVETEDQRNFLAQNGCFAYQGYLFSRPLPAAEI